PLFAAGDKLVGVITVVGAASAFRAEAQGETADLLLQAAEAMSARMGGRMPAAPGRR
ncbi:IclR family transcriptional regulator, partial [Pseudomonas sp. CrR25]|nr:IclR family transcriptional regulator [Pseudomonas sp. CrR25]